LGHSLYPAFESVMEFLATENDVNIDSFSLFFFVQSRVSTRQIGQNEVAAREEFCYYNKDGCKFSHIYCSIDSVL
jgi:hypothetical protein